MKVNAIIELEKKEQITNPAAIVTGFFSIT